VGKKHTAVLKRVREEEEAGESRKRT